LTQARHIVSSSETDWSDEQRREIETLINDIEQLRDVVCFLQSFAYYCLDLYNHQKILCMFFVFAEMHNPAR